MTAFMHRDCGQWDRLRKVFHHDAVIHIMWFNGRADDFVTASSQMAKTELSSKHDIANPLIHFNGPRAISETNATIITEDTALRLICTSHIRFLDRLEERDGVWRILHRRSIYDFSSYNATPRAGWLIAAEPSASSAGPRTGPLCRTECFGSKTP
ncbi:MAG TPA: nuclear transport factor 2 family protein, partial [Mycobacterium sp.]